MSYEACLSIPCVGKYNIFPSAGMESTRLHFVFCNTRYVSYEEEDTFHMRRRIHVI
jgi:hypothetical protein